MEMRSAPTQGEDGKRADFRNEAGRASGEDLQQEENIFTLMQMKLRMKDEPLLGNPNRVEEMLGRYYRFKIFWKQEAIRNFLEGHLGIKMNQVREFQRTRRRRNESNPGKSSLPPIARIPRPRVPELKKKRKSVFTRKSKYNFQKAKRAKGPMAEHSRPRRISKPEEAHPKKTKKTDRASVDQRVRLRSRFVTERHWWPTG